MSDRPMLSIGYTVCIRSFATWRHCTQGSLLFVQSQLIMFTGLEADVAIRED